MKELTALESLMGLREELRIVYVVDGYSAELCSETNRVHGEAHGETIVEALEALNAQVAGQPRD